MFQIPSRAFKVIMLVVFILILFLVVFVVVKKSAVKKTVVKPETTQVPLTPVNPLTPPNSPADIPAETIPETRMTPPVVGVEQNTGVPSSAVSPNEALKLLPTNGTSATVPSVTPSPMTNALPSSPTTPASPIAPKGSR